MQLLELYWKIVNIVGIEEELIECARIVAKQSI